MTDEEIINGCKNSNLAAQKCLYDRFARKMMGICVRYTQSTETAQDLLQDGFIKVFEKIKTFKRDGTLDGWITKVIVNTALDHLRKVKHEKFKIEIDNDEDWEKIDPDDSGGIMESISAKDLLKQIQNLPPGFRTIFNLYAIEGYTHKEIGVMLNIEESTSKSQYSRARVHLQKMLQPEKVFS